MAQNGFGMVPIWTVLPNSRTCSFPQQRSSATATSTSEALKCLSSGLRAPLMAEHSLEGTSRKKRSPLLLTCYFSMTLLHDGATCKRFSHLSLFSRGTLDHKTAMLSSGVNPSNMGGGQWLRPMGHGPEQNFSQLLAVLQSLLLISSVPNNNLYIFWSINLLDSNNSVQLRRCTLFPSSEADHKLNVC